MRIAIVVAHPDDEAVGAGAQLHRLKNLTLICATNGAPRDGRDLRRVGCDSVEAYANRRRAELAAALEPLRLAENNIVHLDISDGEAIFALGALTARLAEMFTRHAIEIVLTHAYEGGHPDHDALALAVRLAAQLCQREPDIVEMPFYHAAGSRWVRQRFCDAAPAPTILSLDADAFARKCAMLDAHRSQAELLRDFRQPIESFRLAPAHDFTRAPRADGWLYAQVAPALSPKSWLAHARAAMGRT